MSVLRSAVFLTTVADLRQLPRGEGTREVAFAGRSNAGKSSAINAIVDHNRLAFVSKTPGRTQLLNFFAVGESGRLVDLPGYGYARTPAAVRDKFDALITPYLRHRETLAGLILIMDCRHPMTPLDDCLIEWFRPRGRPLHVLLTKADKLSRQEQVKALRAVQAELARRKLDFSVQLFSSLRKVGLDEARTVIESWLGLAGVTAAREKEAAAAVGLPPRSGASPDVLRHKKRKPPVKGRTGGENALT